MISMHDFQAKAQRFKTYNMFTIEFNRIESRGIHVCQDIFKPFNGKDQSKPNSVWGLSLVFLSDFFKKNCPGYINFPFLPAAAVLCSHTTNSHRKMIGQVGTIIQ